VNLKPDIFNSDIIDKKQLKHLLDGGSDLNLILEKKYKIADNQSIYIDSDYNACAMIKLFEEQYYYMFYGIAVRDTDAVFDVKVGFIACSKNLTNFSFHESQKDALELLNEKILDKTQELL